MRETTRRATLEGVAAGVDGIGQAAATEAVVADPVAVLRSLLVGAGVWPKVADTLLESPAVLGMTPAAMAAEIAAASAIAAGGAPGALLVHRLRKMAPKGLLPGKGRGVDRAARTQQTRSSGPERDRGGVAPIASGDQVVPIDTDEPIATAEERAAIREAMEWKQALDRAMQEKTPQDIEPFRVWSAMNDGDRRLEIEVKPGEAIGLPVRMIAVWLRMDPSLRVSLQDHRRDLRHPDRELSEQQAAVDERVLDLVAATLLDKPPARRATPEEQAAERARAARERQRAAALDEKTPSDMKPFTISAVVKTPDWFRMVKVEVKPFQRVGLFVDQIVKGSRSVVGMREKLVESRERIELAGKMPADQKRVGLAILDLALEILDEPPAALEAEAVEAAVAPQRPERPEEPAPPPPGHNPVEALRALQRQQQQAGGPPAPTQPDAAGGVDADSSSDEQPADTTVDQISPDAIAGDHVQHEPRDRRGGKGSSDGEGEA
jgi:hypothetical protein